MEIPRGKTIGTCGSVFEKEAIYRSSSVSFVMSIW